MDDDKTKILDLKKDLPFPRYQEQDAWMKFRVPIDNEEEQTGWGE
jgi:hypothetical protein